MFSHLTSVISSLHFLVSSTFFKACFHLLYPTSPFRFLTFSISHVPFLCLLFVFFPFSSYPLLHYFLLTFSSPMILPQLSPVILRLPSPHFLNYPNREITDLIFTPASRHFFSLLIHVVIPPSSRSFAFTSINVVKSFL